MASPDDPAPRAAASADDERRDALVARLFEAALAFNDLHLVYLGDRLGLYRVLADAGPRTSTELADATGTHERYVREWLEHQAVGSILDVDDPGAGARERRYALPGGHAEVLLQRQRALPGAARAHNGRPRAAAAARPGGVPHRRRRPMPSIRPTSSRARAR